MLFAAFGYISTVFVVLSIFTKSNASNSFPEDKCTAIVVSRGGTIDGSTMTTHTADCFECDWRVNKVPARDYPAGAMRPIYLLTGAYPRQVRNDRGYTWSIDNLEDGTGLEGVVLSANNEEKIQVDGIPSVKPIIDKENTMKSEWISVFEKTIIGYIPQVAHTYAVFEGMYGIMNEHQVAMGESTCASKLFAAPMGYGGHALLEVGCIYIHSRTGVCTCILIV